MRTEYKYNPILTVVNGGQFYDVEYSVWNKPSETVSFRTYEEAKTFFNTIPLS
jgi:hypothetical protein